MLEKQNGCSTAEKYCTKSRRRTTMYVIMLLCSLLILLLAPQIRSKTLQYILPIILALVVRNNLVVRAHFALTTCCQTLFVSKVAGLYGINR